MKRERPTNRELDKLGKRLVIAAKPGDGEIDHLVSNPLLYDGVVAKIAAAHEPISERRRRFALKPVAAMAMAVALLSVPLLALLKFSGAGEPVVRAPRAVPNDVAEKPFVPVGAPPRQPAEDHQPGPVRAAVTKTVETPSPPKFRKKRPVQATEPEPVFHPIGLAERAEDAAIDGRVVRVEMPRAALFAMGVDVPLENGTRSIKADLLVGADGSPRAIRLVE